jgi:hypothetical protein
MKTINQIVEEKLSAFPDFRERKHRAKYLSILALRDLGLEQKQKTEMLTLEEMADFAMKYGSYERSWRDCLLNNPSLRGADYEADKQRLMQEKLLELGYSI